MPWPNWISKLQHQRPNYSSFAIFRTLNVETLNVVISIGRDFCTPESNRSGVPNEVNPHPSNMDLFLSISYLPVNLSRQDASFKHPYDYFLSDQNLGKLVKIQKCCHHHINRSFLI